MMTLDEIAKIIPTLKDTEDKERMRKAVLSSFIDTENPVERDYLLREAVEKNNSLTLVLKGTTSLHELEDMRVKFIYHAAKGLGLSGSFIEKENKRLGKEVFHKRNFIGLEVNTAYYALGFVFITLFINYKLLRTNNYSSMSNHFEEMFCKVAKETVPFGVLEGAEFRYNTPKVHIEDTDCVLDNELKSELRKAVLEVLGSYGCDNKFDSISILVD